MPALMKVGGENIRVFVNGSILYGGPVASVNFVDLSEPAIQKIDLQVESPPGHILIEVA